MAVTKEFYRTKLMTLLDDLPEAQLREVYHFTIFLKNWTEEDVTGSAVPSAPVSHLRSLLGLIAVSGDAVQETEDIYHA